MDTGVLVLSSGSMSLSLVSFAMIVFIIVTQQKKKRSGGSGGSGGGSGGPGNPMPIPAMKKNSGAPWNVFGIVNPSQISSDGTAVKITYLPNKAGMDSGAAFKASPTGLPAMGATLGYSVFWPAGTNVNKGGKLPGLLFAGSKTAASATGGNWYPNAGSARVMFRENQKMIGYTYLAVKGGALPAYAAQNAAYKAVSNPSNSTTGHDIWYKKGGNPFGFLLNAWNDVTLQIRMNTVGKSDGLLSITVNDVTRTLNDVKWREDASVLVQSIEFVSFYGGGDTGWACSVGSGSSGCKYAQFKNLRFSAAK